MKLLSGKAEIIYLLTKVVEKYEEESGFSIAKNTNRKNYEPLARHLSDISNQLPYTAETLQHDTYPIDYNPKKLEYPFRKYDITSSQIKDAFFNQIISNPRPFMVEACYIYLYGIGRKGFVKNPLDKNLIAPAEDTPLSILEQEQLTQHENNRNTNRNSVTNWAKFLTILLLVLIGLTLWLWYKLSSATKEWEILKKDMKIVHYKASQAEIDSLEGIWLCYVGSPQARKSDPNRFHTFLKNITKIDYKKGYFTLSRYGAYLFHEGYAQFESPWIASIHTYAKIKDNLIESPRHSLMRLDKDPIFKSVISASWNFDIEEENKIIGIREVYVKQGKGGYLEEMFNTRENADCKCKIVKWHKEDGSIVSFQLKNERLENLPDTELQGLINENSILFRVPTEGVFLKDTLHRN